ncbi:aldo/keto reductase [Sporosarcina sp. P20a]|uniref:aldo/keto reductase n=1 Tax=Sporosarcina sp. P20a TaxID=2048256 RepID=UPI000C172737|nr:aldo/keto reductase [Sporosarcina sp. P20a]PIC87056.1 aldo/keto reductase [Sporosarcina sp. P20a]
MKNLQSTTTLSNGVEMPWLGLGVFKVEEGTELVNVVKTAIEHGYRSIDTAAIYGNESSVGKGIQATQVDRKELFITSKVWNSELGYEKTLVAFDESITKLGLDYLDLYLIHWPVEGQFKEAWRALETLYEEGKAKAIGVSNFQPHHLEELMKDAKIKPMINQVEYHPRLSQKEVQAFCQKHDIQMEAWSPLMQGELLENAELQEIADRYNKSVAQVILRWDLQNGVVTIPKSTKAHRIAENADVFNFELTSEDMEQINKLNQDQRIGPDPDNFDFS